jgi:hypothetical protein
VTEKRHSIEKPKWTRMQVNNLLDEDLRRKTSSLYYAIRRRASQPNVSALKVSRLETKIVNFAKLVFERYSVLVDVPGGFRDGKANEQRYIVELLDHLFKAAQDHVFRDGEQQDRMASIRGMFKELVRTRAKSLAQFLKNVP